MPVFHLWVFIKDYLCVKPRQNVDVSILTHGCDTVLKPVPTISMKTVAFYSFSRMRKNLAGSRDWERLFRKFRGRFYNQTSLIRYRLIIRLPCRNERLNNTTLSKIRFFNKSRKAWFLGTCLLNIQFSRDEYIHNLLPPHTCTSESDDVVSINY